MESYFEEDKRQEELFGKWLDIHFYPNLHQINNVSISGIERCFDLIRQKQGIDVIIKNHMGEIVCLDEKAALHYITRNINTFSFEIRNDTSGNPGWLYNKYYRTNYYLLAWPKASDVSIPDENAFTTSEFVLIRRDNVINLLNEKGLNEVSIEKKIREHYSKRFTKQNFYLADGVILNFNITLPERPINVLISKELLREYGEYSGTIR